MFEKYMIVPEEAKNIKEGNKITGFQFGARLPYYRGLGLSMVEDIKVTVDDTPVESDQITLTVHGNSYKLKEMETEAEDRWEMGEVATISVNKDGGISVGEHKIELVLTLRISYMPFPAVSKSSKKIVIK
ncbi:MAG: DUF6379 domain-containing protein [Ignavibacteria bacterium]|jgi:hypothetical protein